MASEENAQWEYKPGDGDTAQTVTADEAPEDTSDRNPSKHQSSKSSSVTWTASEYIEHERGGGWYFLLILVTAALAAGIYFLTKDYFATGIIVIVGIIVAIFAGRKPREMEYELTASELRIGPKSYPYSLFKSFAIIRDGALNSVNLSPIKRFMPPISAYFSTKDEKKITEVLADHLPYEERKLDSVERLSRRLRF